MTETNLIKNNGQVYTPPSFVNLILDVAEYYGEQILQKHFIDNSCGNGAFICEAIRRYIKAYQEKYDTLDGVSEEIEKYIHGIEIETTAYEKCAANVSLVFFKYGIKGNVDLILGNTLNISSFDGKMDYVIGNPPYVRVHNLKDNFDAVKSYSFASSGMTDLFIVFFEIGFRMLKEGGKLCYITPNSWLNSVAGHSLRQHILKTRDLVSVIDIGHYQPFEVQTYTLISLFVKGSTEETFDYYSYNEYDNDVNLICEIPFDKVCIGDFFYLGEPETLDLLKDIREKEYPEKVHVKNGFCTQADKIFLSQDFPFEKYVIPAIKGSTAKEMKAFFPYDENGTPVDKDVLFSNKDISDYLNANKEALLKGKTERQKPDWYLYGRTQAIADVFKNKVCTGALLSLDDDVKISYAPKGTGVNAGYYILGDITEEEAKHYLHTDEFRNYIASLKKYKSGGYFTFNVKDLELYLNYKLSNGKEKEDKDDEIVMDALF